MNTNMEINESERGKQVGREVKQLLKMFVKMHGKKITRK